MPSFDFNEGSQPLRGTATTTVARPPGKKFFLPVTCVPFIFFWCQSDNCGSKTPPVRGATALRNCPFQTNATTYSFQARVPNAKKNTWSLGRNYTHFVLGGDEVHNHSVEAALVKLATSESPPLMYAAHILHEHLHTGKTPRRGRGGGGGAMIDKTKHKTRQLLLQQSVTA